MNDIPRLGDLAGYRTSLDRPGVTPRNNLLRTLISEDLARLTPHLSPTVLEVRRAFTKPGVSIHEVCFPDAGIISVVDHAQGGRRLQTGLIGFEGMTGLPVILGADRWPNATYVHQAGHGWVIKADALRDAMARSESLRGHLLHYAAAYTTFVGQTALANARAKLDERLARWLLMASDRLDQDPMRLTHEFLGLMLGVRRPGVTEAIHRLEGDLLIRARRGSITIRDRPGLEWLAGAFYGVAEAEYGRLIGPLIRSYGSVPGTLLPAIAAVA